MAEMPEPLHWSSQFVVASRLTPKLPGDKITLPQSALEQLLAAAPLKEVTSDGHLRPYTSIFDPLNPYTFTAESRVREQVVSRQHQLPHPLTFRVVNPQNGRAVYAGIREFSAEENEISLSAFLRTALGAENDPPLSPTDAVDRVKGVSVPSIEPQPLTVTVHAKQLPRGTYVRLRPLEAGYDVEDWKALLERHLRDNYTTLTTGESLTVSGGQDESFRFLVDKVEPEGDGICVVDTDLEVDIVALTEDQARETLQRRLDKASRPPGTNAGTSIGGALGLGESVSGQVIPGQYVDYELHSWDCKSPIELVLEIESTDLAGVFLLASPFSARQRNRPRADEHVFGDFSSSPLKRISIQPTNVELDGAEALYISVHAFAHHPQDIGIDQSRPLQFNLHLAADLSADGNELLEDDASATHDPEDVRCKNCHQWVPHRSLLLHENFCLRNNVFCAQCRNVFQKTSPEWQNHWHCAHDSLYGSDLLSKQRHDTIFHDQYKCHACGFETDGLPRLAQHRTTVCPGKPILCRFCHLVVPQKGESDPEMDNPEVLVSELTPHELVDGGRTTECHLCNKFVRLRDMKTHLRHHDLDRLSQPPPSTCLNKNCGRTIDRRAALVSGNDTLGLCSICFGPLYVDTYDPEGKALRRRIERRYLSQMMTGCGKSYCQNEYCKNGRQARLSSESNRGTGPNTITPPPLSTSAATILATVRPLIEALNLRSDQPNTAPFYFCTDQVGQQRRILAEILATEVTMTGGDKSYDLPWCIAAVEAAGSDLNKAREWLENWAPAQGEDASSLK
ncbi:putative ubiquitin fusion degradation protein (Ufd1) [Aspergillus tanneri]|uniref:Uncharacterized protein n=1 Tax=Aspergillus tanneri TaxID=1220188 RepID=A0A5M9MXF7_9EURO|nr:uncharacterized protein ATNIH1004_002725 [Aspergillus tanneri]KAA8650044.1 hypothetical protein ATNIH1004_002725 [Aspergillus tanneri]